MKNNTIVEVNCLEHIYPDKTKVELCGLEFTVEKGEKVAVLGPNGGGKTTLIKHLLGLLSPQKGEIRVFDKNPAKDFNKIREKLGVVLQNVEEQLIGPTVIEDIMFSPLNYDYPKEEALKLANDIMEKLDILHLKDKLIHYLSGGEKRKVALAGALVLKPELLILDEPFTALDLKSKRDFINIINNFSKENNMSIVISTHEVELVSEFADTLYLICKNNISTKGTPKEVFTNIEILDKFNLNPPDILKLFNILNKNGADLGSPLTVEEAVNILAGKLNI